MKQFIRKYEDRIHGALSCFDRMLFRGYLPIMSGWAMAGVLDRLHQDFSSLKPFLLENSERVKNHAIALAQKHGRPFRYLASNIKKEEAARELAQGDGIQHGLVCIFSILEPCRTFSFLFKKERPNQRPFVKSARRKCLHLYFYFMDRHFGLIHVRIQTWFPMPIQVYLNGHEWLARKLEANGVRFTKHDNAFLWIEDMVRAQKFSDRFANLNWPKILSKYAKLVTPQMQDILQDCSHYWVTAQSELSTDILFRSRQGLSELYPELLSHGTLCFGAKEVMTFLGRKLRGNFEGEIVSDLSDFAGGMPGCRIKHRVKENWIKMYDKSGLVLRVETVINNPEEFKVRKKVIRKGKSKVEWVTMRKGVAYLFRYQQVSFQANSRYLEAEQIGDSFPHGHPFDFAFALADDLLSNFEFLGIVDHGFDPKNETGLVVHLDPVLFDTMLDSASRHTAGEVGEIGDDLSFEIAAQLASKKGHDFLGAKAQCAMAQEFRIKFRKALSASKENIG